MKPAGRWREAIWLCPFFVATPQGQKNKLVFFSAARRALLFALLHFLLLRLARIVTSGAVDFPSLHKRENSLRFPFLLHCNAIKVCALHSKPKFSMITTREAYLIIVYAAAAAGLEKWERETRSSERATDRVTWFAAHQHFRMYPSQLFSLRGGVFLLLWFIQQHKAALNWKLIGSPRVPSAESMNDLFVSI